MKRGFLVLMMALVLGSSARADEAYRIHPQLFTLANGLRLYVQPAHANHDLLIGGTIEVSPAFDPPGQTGTGIIASALLASGVAPEDRARMAFGASFSSAGDAGDLERVIAVLARAERSIAFSQRDFTAVVARERASIADHRSDADAEISTAFERALHAPDDPTLRLESNASLAVVTLRDVVAYAKRYFRPDRTTLVVVGDVAPGAVRDAVVRRFGSWQNRGPRPEIRLPALPPAHRNVVTIPVQRADVSVRLGRPAIGRTDPDFFAYNLLGAVLTGRGFASELLVTRERGIFTLRVSGPSGSISHAVSGAKAAARRLTVEPVSAAEWERARAQLLAGARVTAEQTAKIAALCERIADNRLPLDYYETIGARYGAVTPADGLRVARRYLIPDDYVEVYAGPFFARPKRAVSVQ
jgi:zinc protease